MKVISALILIACLAFTAGCTPAQPASPAPAQTSLLVFAAASLTESFTEMAQAFEQENPDVDVQFNFANSNTLAEQIIQDAPADVFAPAAMQFMTRLEEQGWVDPQDRRIFAHNQMSVILPKENPANLTSLNDLARPGVKLVLGAREGPQGAYVETLITNLSAAPGFGAAFKEQVYSNVVSFESTVKGVVNKVSLGEADAGIVYATDAASAADTVITLPIPPEYNLTAVYPIAAPKNTPHRVQAQAFVDFVLSPAGQNILAKYGFLPPEE
ncbi:MAG: molybdate ABC transporter substrate-binding protein [Chloroflexota bacterium]|jgi:molybdate transport system substrate-binding protein